MEIDVPEAKMILASFSSWEAQARSDEPHWTYDKSYTDFKAKVKNFFNENSK